MITPAAWGISLFFLTFWLPLPSVFPFMILAVTGTTLLFSKIPAGDRTRTVVTILVVLFALGSIFTIVVSRDLQRSISTSLHQEMGILLFFIIAYGFKGKKDFILTFITLMSTTRPFSTSDPCGMQMVMVKSGWPRPFRR